MLLPFITADRIGEDPRWFGFLLAAFGVGGVIGSIVVSSRPLPRRYLTAMNLVWGFSTLPFIVMGFTDQYWLMLLSCFLVGFGFSYGNVIWGTLLQRRVPTHMLGRVSSLDFFVSLALMPLSMALAGPLAQVVPIPVIFLVAGPHAVPPVVRRAPVAHMRRTRSPTRWGTECPQTPPPSRSHAPAGRGGSCRRSSCASPRPRSSSCGSRGSAGCCSRRRWSPPG